MGFLDAATKSAWMVFNSINIFYSYLLFIHSLDHFRYKNDQTLSKFGWVIAVLGIQFETMHKSFNYHKHITMRRVQLKK